MGLPVMFVRVQKVKSMSEQQPDPLAWVAAKQEDDAVKWASHKSFAASCVKKNTYHTAGEFDGVNHWGDFLELCLVLSHIKWQRERIRELERQVQAAVNSPCWLCGRAPRN